MKQIFALILLDALSLKMIYLDIPLEWEEEHLLDNENMIIMIYLLKNKDMLKKYYKLLNFF